MWNRSPRSMPAYVHVRPPALPRSPVCVHVSPYGGNSATSTGVRCESAQPTLFTGWPGGVLGHWSMPSTTPAMSLSQLLPQPSIATSAGPDGASAAGPFDAFAQLITATIAGKIAAPRLIDTTFPRG